MFVTVDTFIDDWLGNIVGPLVVAARSAGKSRFIVYWIGYPQFFEVRDDTCDSDYFWIWPFPWRWYSGEYLVLLFRERMNDISVLINLRIANAIDKWNADLPYPEVQFIDPDADSLWNGERFCEPGITEPQPSSAQGTVAFFYPNGPDLLPSDCTLPDPLDGAPGDWSMDVEIINLAANCTSETDETGSTGYPYYWCDMAIFLAANPDGISEFTTTLADDGDPDTTATLNADGSVTIASSTTKYTKMFHPKSASNLRIAQWIGRELRYN